MNRQTMRKLMLVEESNFVRPFCKSMADLEKTVADLILKMKDFSIRVADIDFAEYADVLCDDGIVRFCKIQRVSTDPDVTDVFSNPDDRRFAFGEWDLVHKFQDEYQYEPRNDILRQDTFVCSYYNGVDDWGIFYRHLKGYVAAYMYEAGVRRFLNPPKSDKVCHISGTVTGRFQSGGIIRETCPQGVNWFRSMFTNNDEYRCDKPWGKTE